MYVNWKRINSFIDIESEEDQKWLKTSILDLIGNFNDKLEQIRTLLDKNDLPQIQSILHQMKGVAANFGLEDIAHTTLQCETLLKENKFTEAELNIKSLYPIWKETHTELESKIK